MKNFRHSVILSFHNLSNGNFFVTLFPWTVKPRRLKLDTFVDSGQNVDVSRNQTAAAYSSLYFFIFLSLQFSSIKFFVTLFSGTVMPRRLKLGTHMDNGWMYHAYRNQAAAAYLSLYLFTFLPLQFPSTEKFRHTFLRALKVETWYTHGQWVDVSCILNVFITFFSRTARHNKLKQYKNEE